MYQSLRHNSQESRQGSKEGHWTFPNGAFRDNFALEEHDSAQIYPCTSGKCPQFVLPLASVAGLVVPGVEAELEDGDPDVVPFVLLPDGDVRQLFSGMHRLQLFVREVAPLVLGSVPGWGMRSAPLLVGLAS